MIACAATSAIGESHVALALRLGLCHDRGPRSDALCRDRSGRRPVELGCAARGAAPGAPRARCLWPAPAGAAPPSSSPPPPVPPPWAPPAASRDGALPGLAGLSFL